MQEPTIAIIGAGKMGSCLIAGLIKHGHHPNKIWASNNNSSALTALKDRFGIQSTPDNSIAAMQADVIILALKPKMIPSACKEIATAINPNQIIISVAAGIKIADMRNWLQHKGALVRAMPNIAASIGMSATALFAETNLRAQDHALAQTILNSIGTTDWVEKEELLNAVTALSGSGPAYFFLFMEALAEAATKLGLSKEIATHLTIQTALGSANMAKVSQQSLHELREAVTSKGGTTEKALSIFNEHALSAIIEKALVAAKNRGEELANAHLEGK